MSEPDLDKLYSEFRSVQELIDWINLYKEELQSNLHLLEARRLMDGFIVLNHVSDAHSCELLFSFVGSVCVERIADYEKAIGKRS